MDILQKKNISRRGFVYGTAALFASLQLLSFGSKNSQGSQEARVGLIMTTDRSEAVKRALRLFPLPPLVGKRVLIKPNFNTAHPSPGSTHNDTLEILIDALYEGGASSIIIGERSGPPNTQKVMEEKGIFALARQKRVSIVDFDLLKEEDLLFFQDPRMHWSNGFHIPRILTEVDHIIATPCLKTHQFGGVFTMALKLAVGIIPKNGTTYMTELHRSSDMEKMIAEINLAYRPDLFIVDGVSTFVTGGPSTGERISAGVTIVGEDPVAVDGVGVAMLKHLGSTHAIMSKPIFSQGQIQRGSELGLGVSHPSQIKLIADDAEGLELVASLEKILAQG